MNYVRTLNSLPQDLIRHALEYAPTWQAFATNKHFASNKSHIYVYCLDSTASAAYVSGQFTLHAKYIHLNLVGLDCTEILPIEGVQKIVVGQCNNLTAIHAHGDLKELRVWCCGNLVEMELQQVSTVSITLCSRFMDVAQLKGASTVSIHDCQINDVSELGGVNSLAIGYCMRLRNGSMLNNNRLMITNTLVPNVRALRNVWPLNMSARCHVADRIKFIGTSRNLLHITPMVMTPAIGATTGKIMTLANIEVRRNDDKTVTVVQTPAFQYQREYPLSIACYGDSHESTEYLRANEAATITTPATTTTIWVRRDGYKNYGSQIVCTFGIMWDYDGV